MHLNSISTLKMPVVMWILLAPFLLARVGSAVDLKRNASQCVSNRGHAYTEPDCLSVAKAYGCKWESNECVCANGGVYSKRSHYCWPPEIDSTTTTTTRQPAVPAAEDPSGPSVCRSNSGRPYDEDHCNTTAKAYHCEWRDGACVCSNGGTYAKRSHYCWPPTDPTSTTTTTTTPSVTPAANESTCVSNRGFPYDSYDCSWVAKDYGCVWQAGMCTCQNGGVFSKTSKKCWPPSSTPTPPPCQECGNSSGRWVKDIWDRFGKSLNIGNFAGPVHYFSDLNLIHFLLLCIGGRLKAIDPKAINEFFGTKLCLSSELARSEVVDQLVAAKLVQT